MEVSMDPLEEKLDFLFKVLDKNLHWISYADTKGTVLFSLISAMLAVIAGLVPPLSLWTIAPSIFSSITVLILFAGIGFVVFAQFPRLEGPKNSLVYFGGISAHDEPDYISKIFSSSVNDLAIDLAKQCHRNAVIAKTKFILIKNATLCLFIALPFWLLSIWYLYPIKMIGSKN